MGLEEDCILCEPFAQQSSSRNCSPPAELMLSKLAFPPVFFSTGVFFQTWRNRCRQSAAYSFAASWRGFCGRGSRETTRGAASCLQLWTEWAGAARAGGAHSRASQNSGRLGPRPWNASAGINGTEMVMQLDCMSYIVGCGAVPYRCL